jgi:hypothetical protein
LQKEFGGNLELTVRGRDDEERCAGDTKTSSARDSIGRAQANLERGASAHRWHGDFTAQTNAT